MHTVTRKSDGLFVCSEVCLVKKARGFTLVELLVVIAIVMLLAGILFPVLKGARDRGLATQCLNNLKQLGAALEL
jgi:prepilin-type N-terminal cleavage/methylation domain-containing protein